LDDVDEPTKTSHGNLGGRRIALICPAYPPSGESGIGSATYHLATGLADLGHDVHVFAWLDPVGGADTRQNGVAVHRLPNPRWLKGLEFNTLRGLKWTRYILSLGSKGSSYGGLVRDLRATITLRLLARSGTFDGFDVIEAPEWGAANTIFLDQRLSSIGVTRLHGSLYSHYHRFQPFGEPLLADARATAWLERRGTLASDVVIGSSRAIAADARDWLAIDGPIHIVPNCIHLPSVDAVRPRGEGYRHESDTIRVVFSGRLDNLKGAHIIDAVVSELRRKTSRVRFHFLLAGNCPDPSRYPALCTEEDSGVRVQLVGALTTPGILQLLWQSDLFLFPSHAENCPMSLLEAMACGLAIIASDAGGIPEMLDDAKDGFVCPRGDVRAFVASLEALADPALRVRLGKSARHRVERDFSSNVIARQWLELCLPTSS
jgi:glycosyltransferase involved in cell wall biosynthesis